MMEQAKITTKKTARKRPKKASVNIRREIRVLRPALIAALFGFGLGISTCANLYGAQGLSYVALSIYLGIGYSVVAFFIVLVFQGIRRYFTKPRADDTVKKSSPGLLMPGLLTHMIGRQYMGRSFSFTAGLFTAINSNKKALTAIWASAVLLIIFSLYNCSLRILYYGNVSFDGILILGLAVIVLYKKSRFAATGLLLFSVFNVFAVGHNRFFGGEGGANLFGALLIAWASVRLVIATFRLHSNRTSEPKVVSLESVDSQVTSSSADQISATEARLSELRRLFEKGLITQIVYEQRQAEILHEK